MEFLCSNQSLACVQTPFLNKNRRGGGGGVCTQAIKRVSMGWWLLRLSAKILALLRLSVNFFQLRLTKKLKINFFCFKKLNIN